MGKYEPIRFTKGRVENSKRWENHAFHYAKCEYGSEDFDKLLEEGYEQFGQLTRDNQAYMKKAK
jgi:hypothetical protein